VTEVGVESSPAGAASSSFPLPFDMHPADLAAELVARSAEADGDQYLLYERDDEWVLAIGVLAIIELDCDELRIIRDGVTQRQTWCGRPGPGLGSSGRAPGSLFPRMPSRCSAPKTATWKS
jgi:salicylate synthetase